MKDYSGLTKVVFIILTFKEIQCRQMDVDAGVES